MGCFDTGVEVDYDNGVDVDLCVIRNVELIEVYIDEEGEEIERYRFTMTFKESPVAESWMTACYHPGEDGWITNETHIDFPGDFPLLLRENAALVVFDSPLHDLKVQYCLTALSAN